MDTSGRPFKESEEDFGDARADSESAGQEAPMTGLTSITPFDGLFQAGLFVLALALLLPLLPLSELSVWASGTVTSVNDGLAGDRSESAAADSDGVIIGTHDDDRVVTVNASDSLPRTMCDHGEEGWRETVRRERGLPRASPESDAMDRIKWIRVRLGYGRRKRG